jgi:hypothetical protein
MRVFTERTGDSCSCPRSFLLFLAASAVFLLAPVATWGQQVSAAITGKITDQTGASVPDAKVTATDTQRGTVWSTVTNDSGVYNLPRVPIGTYTLKVEKPGFQTAEQPQFTLQMNQIARIDVSLQVGNVQQTVEVTGAAPVLQTQSTDLGQVIDSRTNVDLPLATRNYVQLTLLAPGSIHPNPSTFKSGQTTGSSGRPNVNGNREQANNFMLDGLDNNQVSDNLVGYAPAVDAIQEFNEITNNAPAEFGNFMGAIVNASIKSGTNSFHGDAYEFFRNNVLNANNWTNNWEGNPRPAVRWNNFGGTFGGPIKKDKLFFFTDYQGSRLDTPTSVRTTSVFTPEERQGNFSQLLTGSKPIQLYNPFSLDANGNRTPFPGNIIPSQYFSAAATKILTSQYYPTPTGPGLLNNYQYAVNAYTNGDQGDAKVDWNISDKDRFFARYSQARFNNPSTITGMPLFYNSFNDYPSHTGDLDWTRTVSPALVNEARFGVNYVFINNGAASNGLTDFAQTVGIPGVPSAFLPSMSLSGGNAASFGTSDVYQLFADTVIQASDSVIYTHGNHTMHMGFQAYRYRVDTFYSGNNGRAGTILFNGQYTAGPAPGTRAGVNPASGLDTGIPEADFLLGLPNEIQGGVNGGTWGQRSNTFAAYFQDDWRATPNLTLNLGLRWELYTPWDEVRNRQANFNLVTGQEYISGQACPYSNCNALYNQYNGITDFQPRIGLAYSMGKTVFRAGYTLSNYLEGTGTNLRLPINPPFAVEHDNQYTTAQYNVLPGSTLDQGFLPFTSNAGDQFHSVTLRVWDPNVRPAVSNQWNFTIEHQMTQSMTLSASYVGQRTTHLMVPMPYFQKVLNPNGTVSPTRYLAGNPALLSDIGQISGTASIGNQSYNALQVVLNQRLNAGLQFSLAYTYSKCMTNNQGYYGQGGQAGQSNWYFMNIYDASLDWGPCDYDATHNFVANTVYALPFGRGMKFGHNMNRALDAVIGGWQASGILSLHTGFPLTITAADASGTLSRGMRADCTAPATVFGTQDSPKGGYQWFDPSAFAQPTPGTFGTCGVGTVRGPGLRELDMSLMKDFAVTEHQRLELRGDFVNLSNTPILNSPTRGVGPNLGLLQSAQGERNIQLALKYIF